MSLRQTRNGKASYLRLVIFAITLSTAAALFEDCDETYSIDVGETILESPNYPNSFPAGTSCRYKYTAPLYHEITLNCTVNFDEAQNDCTESFYVSLDGDLELSDAEQFCGSHTFERKSLFRSVVLAYSSAGSVGSFRCVLSVEWEDDCDCGWSSNRNVTNGQLTYAREFPSIVAIKDVTSPLPAYCAGVIIAHEVVLAGASCYTLQENYTQIRLLVGYDNLKTPTKYSASYEVKTVIKYPLYTPQRDSHDLIIFHTKIPIEWNRGVGPICLPPWSLRNQYMANAVVDAVGWDITESSGTQYEDLQKVNLMTTDEQTCDTASADLGLKGDEHICTTDTTGNHQNSCQLTPGGPVVLSAKSQFILGIIPPPKLCSTGVNTSVQSYLNWIYQLTMYTACVKNNYES